MLFFDSMGRMTSPIELKDPERAKMYVCDKNSYSLAYLGHQINFWVSGPSCRCRAAGMGLLKELCHGCLSIERTSPC